MGLTAALGRLIRLLSMLGEPREGGVTVYGPNQPRRSWLVNLDVVAERTSTGWTVEGRGRIQEGPPVP